MLVQNFALYSENNFHWQKCNATFSYDEMEFFKFAWKLSLEYHTHSFHIGNGALESGSVRGTETGTDDEC